MRISDWSSDVCSSDLVKGRDHPWVSRGGVKLAGGLDHFGWDVTGAVALDVGASPGGFTDVLLTRGAKRVYAVDVEHGQLAWPMRGDPPLIRSEARRVGKGVVGRDNTSWYLYI